MVEVPVALELSSSSLLWNATGEAIGYDVVFGDLGALRSSGGDFSQATLDCLTNDQPGTTLASGVPPDPGEGFWFLVRPEVAGGGGSYDLCGTSPRESRDAGIAASGQGCS